MNKLVCVSASTKPAFNNYLNSIHSQHNCKSILNNQDVKIYKMANKKSNMISLWGCRNSERIKSKWSNLNINDYLLFYSQGKFISLSKIIGLISSNKISQNLWGNCEYNLIILLDDTIFIDKPKDKFWNVFKYSPKAKIQGLSIPNISIQSNIFREDLPLSSQILSIL